jgi:hypothetical protein
VSQFDKFPNKEQAGVVVRLLAACGIKAATDPAKLGHKGKIIYAGKGVPLYCRREDSEKIHRVLELSRRLEVLRDKGPVKLPPDEGTLEFLDMLIHDCRQYLMIATGEIKTIAEEGVLALEEPTKDIHKITIRLKRLKDQCLRQTGRTPLDWQHGGGMGVE